MKERLVFSTDGLSEKKPKKGSKTYERGNGPTKMRLETKGRGGKAVTVLFNLDFEEKEAKVFMKSLQQQLACGATFKNSRIELRGDLRDAIEDIFLKQGLKIVRAGG